MGYVNGPQMIRDIAQMAHDVYGVTIVYSPGWESRGNGQNWTAGGPKGFVNHHTAGGNNVVLDGILVSGRPDLDGPLCNFAGLYDGDLAVVAAYPANHAGASGGWDTAPLPKTGLFNKEVLGIEMQYKGTEPMSPEQYRTMLVVNRCAAIVLGWPLNQITTKTHNGTSIQGKWDPGYANGRTYDIAAIRRDIIKLGGGADDSKTWDAIDLQFMGSK